MGFSNVAPRGPQTTGVEDGPKADGEK